MGRISGEAEGNDRCWSWNIVGDGDRARPSGVAPGVLEEQAGYVEIDRGRKIGASGFGVNHGGTSSAILAVGPVGIAAVTADLQGTFKEHVEVGSPGTIRIIIESRVDGDLSENRANRTGSLSDPGKG